VPPHRVGEKRFEIVHDRLLVLVSAPHTAASHDGALKPATDQRNHPAAVLRTARGPRVLWKSLHDLLRPRIARFLQGQPRLGRETAADRAAAPSGSGSRAPSRPDWSSRRCCPPGPGAASTPTPTGRRQAARRHSPAANRLVSARMGCPLAELCSDCLRWRSSR
jgi:hypothetical protein